MKKSLLFTLAILPALFGTSCNDSTKKVNVYRSKDVIDKAIDIKFFKDCPNVPYISVTEFYKEFFATELTKVKNFSTGYEYLYMSPSKEYMSFSTSKHTLATSGILSFDNNPNYSTSTGKLFIRYESAEGTQRQVKVINLKDYGIKLYERKKEAYAPLTLLSDLSGGLSGFDVTYNGKDIYVFDKNGYLGKSTGAEYFGSNYLSVLSDTSSKRPNDLVNYNYNELCLVFDHLRGHTKQMVFGDDKLESLGLDRLLSNEHPKIKEYLLSTDKSNYYEGLVALFNGLADGGHTGLTFGFQELLNARDRQSEQDFVNLLNINSES